MRAVRLDKSKFNNLVRTPQGFIRAPVYATRTGVFTYQLGDGNIRRELRHPEDVFAAASLASLAGIPITDDHPHVKNPEHTLLDAANAKNYMVGFTGDTVSADDIYVATTVTITDAEAIALIEKGKHEVSCGYSCDHEEISGVYEGEAYDVRQRNIEYNHLALVTKGRGGPSVRLRLDAADAVQVDDLNPLEVKQMKIVLNGVEFEVADDLATALKKELERNYVGIGVKLDADERADKADAKADGLTAEVETLRASLAAKTDAADPVKIRQAAKARVRVLKVAERILTAEKVATLDALEDNAIMVEVIKAESKKGINLDGKTETYIEAYFDIIADRLEAESNRNADIGTNLHNVRADAAAADDDVVEAARIRQREHTQNAWKAQKA